MALRRRLDETKPAVLGVEGDARGTDEQGGAGGLLTLFECWPLMFISEKYDGRLARLRERLAELGEVMVEDRSSSSPSCGLASVR